MSFTTFKNNGRRNMKQNTNMMNMAIGFIKKRPLIPMTAGVLMMDKMVQEIFMRKGGK